MNLFYDYERLFSEYLPAAKPFKHWLDQGLEKKVETAILHHNNGHRERWERCFANLPDVQPSHYELTDTIRIGKAEDLSADENASLKETLRLLHPWRKGPLSFFDCLIETEWRSDWKWQRVLPHISSLRGKRVLDVGAGNGYFGLRMIEAGASLVLGVEPFLAFIYQHLATRKYLPTLPNYLLPFGIEEVPPEMKVFDSVFSMGVLYHRKSPIDHLLDLKGQLVENGELVLETLVVNGDVTTALVPAGRYAKMRNVWFIPSTLMLENWLQKVGFKNIRLVDLNRTSCEEQRATDWMIFESLQDFLHPTNPHLTIEGYPAPLRATMIANA